MTQHSGLGALLAMGLFREIPGHVGYYADVLGRIWSTHCGGNTHRPGSARWPALHRIGMYADRDGYFTVIVMLSGRRIRRTVHRLVALAFHGARPRGHVCAHYNGIKTDNHPDNLVYVTQRENVVDHMERHGTRARGERSHLAKLSEEQARDIWARLRTGESQAPLAREYGVCVSTIWGLKTGRTWSHLAELEAQTP